MTVLIYYLSGIEPVVGVVITWCSFEGADNSLGHGFTYSRHVIHFLCTNKEAKNQEK